MVGFAIVVVVVVVVMSALGLKWFSTNIITSFLYIIFL